MPDATTRRTPTSGDLVTRRAPLAPSSIDTEAMTVTVVWATSEHGDVIRSDYAGRYIERLSLDPAAVDLSRLIGGPLLNAHRQGDLADVLGTVRDASVDGSIGLAEVQFSPRARPVFDDIAAGLLRQVSVGYIVHEWSDAGTADDGTPIRVATRWQPLELSIVPVGADAGATTRGFHGMNTTTTTDQPAEPRAADNAERDRCAEIYRRCGAFKLGSDFADELVRSGVTLDEARGKILDRAADISDRTAPTRPHVVFPTDGLDETSTRAEAMAEALHHRIAPGATLSEQARPYAFMTCVDLARESLRAAGVRGAYSANETITRALAGTSDYPLLLGNVVSKELRAAYATGFGGVRSIAQVTNVRDFRAKSYIDASTDIGLEPVNEHGEFHHGAIKESGESVAVKSYGKIFGITRQALVNDDLGAFQRIGDIASESARSLEADTCVSLLTANAGAGPTMADGVTLFHATHKNLAASGAAISVDRVGAAVSALRKQANLSGKAIGIEPAYIVVPAALEMLAKQLFALNLVPSTAAAVNPFNTMQVIVDPRLDAVSATRWYVVGAYDGLLAAYLEGSSGPVVDTKAGFEVDGVQIRVRLDFGAALVDWRGWQANPGA